LRILADGARHAEQDDGKENEHSEHQAEGIEELRIRGCGLGHCNSLKFYEKKFRSGGSIAILGDSRNSLEKILRKWRKPDSGVFAYGRQFLSVIILALILVATSRFIPAQGILASAFEYGALFSFTTAGSLRAFQPLWKRGMFVVGGGSLSLLSAALGVYGMRFLAQSFRVSAAPMMLALSTGLGAAGYAMLVRWQLGVALSASAIAAISAGCTAAMLMAWLAGLPAGRAGLWFAVCWWFAFSIGLWFHDVPPGLTTLKGR